MKRFLKVCAQMLFLVFVVALVVVGVDDRIIATAEDMEVVSMDSTQETIDQTEHNALNGENIETDVGVEEKATNTQDGNGNIKGDEDVVNVAEPEDVTNAEDGIQVVEPSIKSEPNPTPEPSVEPVKPTISFTDVNEYLYVNTESLNVRTGPGVEYDVISSIAMDTQVHRTGVSEKGWSKLDYNGQNAYVSSAHLSYEQIVINTDVQNEKNEGVYVEEVAKETVAEEMMRRGNIGRLTIPSVGVDVALFGTSVYGGAQPVVDNYDSAAYMPDAVSYYGFSLIADHDNQGFYKIKQSAPGKTRAYIDFGTYSQEYVCVNIFVGYNGYGGRNGLFDINGNDLVGQNDGGICMYTCNSDGTITITYWQPA